MSGVTFGAEDLLLCRQEWDALVSARRELLCGPCASWLAAWVECERGMGVLADEERALVRTGHYWGWLTGRASSTPAP